jgi:hypothetical protein
MAAGVGRQRPTDENADPQPRLHLADARQSPVTPDATPLPCLPVSLLAPF